MLTEIGPRGYHQGIAVATLTYSPLNDRAGVVRRILIDKASAGDIWRCKVQGREVAVFDLQTTGHQQPLSGPYSGYPNTNDLFEVYNLLTGEELIYPVPLGQSFTVASDGGATANITISYTEHTPGELSAGMMNHPLSSRFVGPVVGYRNANVTAVGENAFDTQVGPSWFPNLFVDGDLPPNWRFKVLGMFLEGGGRNTFSGSADHQSTTTYLAILRNGQRMFTRDAAGGIPLIGAASATGSANTVTNNDETPNPAFQDADLFDSKLFAYPFMLGGGDFYQFRLNVAGDVTGGATYAAMRQMFLCDVSVPSGA